VAFEELITVVNTTSTMQLLRKEMRNVVVSCLPAFVSAQTLKLRVT